ncbi:MAG: class III extradiol ring-cleavage dioxygenase [Acidimicrobiales bacterium]|jgi:4,5-DOPA dioxygenase extradiol
MTSPMRAPVPGAAFDAFLRDTAPSSRSRADWEAGSAPMPALFLGHGAPPLFDDPLWIGELFDWSQSLPTPRAILVVSAHWEHAPLRLSATGAAVPLVYDFGGFAERYFTMTYPTPDAGSLAARIASLMPSDEPVHQDPSRGLDHGAWVPLKVMYPYADVPVLQLSIPTHDPARLLELGRRLRPLRDEGVLIIGSGFMTHGLPYLGHREFFDNVVPGWSREFDLWAADALAGGDLDALADYRNRAPGMPYAHPTVEHFIPLFITLGAATDPGRPVETTVEGYQFGLAKRSFEVA